MSISASQVKSLREKTGVGMMECKKALEESAGDMEKAVLWLRERGMSRAAQKAGRAAAEGVVEFALNADSTRAAMVELNCETDFSGKNEDFRSFALLLAKTALEHGVSSVEALSACKLPDGQTVAQQLTALISKIGENMNLRRVKFVEVSQGLVAAYSHMAGKIGTLVVLQGETNDKAVALGADLAMHVAAASPRFFDRVSVDASELDQEKDLAMKKLAEQGKTGELAEKIMLGQMQKFYGEVCFLEQPFVKEPKLTITAYVKQTGVKTVPTAFVRFQLGEGIEIKKASFADEVAAQLSKQ